MSRTVCGKKHYEHFITAFLLKEGGKLWNISVRIAGLRVKHEIGNSRAVLLATTPWHKIIVFGVNLLLYGILGRDTLDVLIKKQTNETKNNT
jgi:hypothetical protein